MAVIADPNSIGWRIETGSRIYAYCWNPPCRHHARLDLHALAGRLGRDFPAIEATLVPRLRCSACGGRHIGIRISSGYASPKGT